MTFIFGKITVLERSFEKKQEQPLTHPFSIYIWHAPRKLTDKGSWIEPVQVYTQEYALYVANLIHADSRAVIKVVRYGITSASIPNKETVDRVERQISRQQAQA